MAPRPTSTTANLQIPSQGTRVLPVQLDFTAANALVIVAGGVFTITDDLLPEMEGGELDIVQSVFIDNSRNPTPLTITYLGIGAGGHPVTAQPFTQGFYPVCVPHGIVRYVAQTQMRLSVLIEHHNQPMPYFEWFAMPALTGFPVIFNPTVIGDNVMLAGVAGRRQNVMQLALANGVANTVQFFDGPSVNALPLSGPFPLAANQQINLPFADTRPWLSTSPGNALVMLASAIGVVGGMGVSGAV